ncbi:MAG: hypothetical protein KDA44_22855 [Planctomycetales bacterium]|nr:hypothetical protein [Planctomycetales bacterium]
MIRLRYEMAVTLVICGTLLAITPPVSDYFARRQIAEVIIARTDFQTVSMAVDTLSRPYRASLWLLGAVMIAVGIGGSISLPSGDREPVGAERFGDASVS